MICFKVNLNSLLINGRGGVEDFKVLSLTLQQLLPSSLFANDRKAMAEEAIRIRDLFNSFIEPSF